MGIARNRQIWLVLTLGGILLLGFFQGSSAKSPLPDQPLLRLGSDRIFEKPYLDWISGKTVGLVANQTTVNSRLERVHSMLGKDSRVQLQAIFAPEHGFQGQEQAGEAIDDQPHIYSLYGKHRAPTPEMLRGIEVLIYDIQDVGSRFYTYISTLYECMKVAGRQGIPLIVLDRPNPIDGTRVEGPLLNSNLFSFVGVHDLPIRYGMTVGELALLFNQEGKLKCQLKVVPLEGWKRSWWYDETGLIWIRPSPNMPTLTTATLYPGMCLLEGTNLSEGRGTTLPFEIVGAPWLDAGLLASKLNALNLLGIRFRPQSFRPVFSKYAGQTCHGIQIHVLDRKQFDPILCTLHLLSQTLKLHPAELKFSDQMFDRLSGNPGIRADLIKGLDVSRIVASWKENLNSFRKRRARHLIYR